MFRNMNKASLTGVIWTGLRERSVVIKGFELLMDGPVAGVP